MRTRIRDRRSQADRILCLLATGRRYSKLDLILKGCGTKPDSRISDLRRDDHDIKDEWVERRGTRFKRYWLGRVGRAQ